MTGTRLQKHASFMLALFYFFKIGNGIVNCSCHQEVNKDGYPLPMYFNYNMNIKFLFDFLQAETMNQFIFYNVLCVLLGFLSIYIKIIKKGVTKIEKKTELKENLLNLNKMCAYWRFNYTLLTFINYTVDYLLMLIRYDIIIVELFKLDNIDKCKIKKSIIKKYKQLFENNNTMKFYKGIKTLVYEKNIIIQYMEYYKKLNKQYFQDLKEIQDSNDVLKHKLNNLIKII
ncbi:copper transporter, putative [Plasmodium vinckei vinckei]|uniref:Copper transporter, putative n=1 Tax=Plasmodium vinckei vinckei TaxID=54757 RepID=A0A449BU47_PLAVN|nr:copper transporter, putative [Plasmodium vinckei vinckei]VEV56922.1 copper transporter, putative [Plasmodium vinckei vinckei]